MDDFLFKVTNGEVEIISSPFQATSSKHFEKGMENVFDIALKLPTKNETVSHKV